MFAYLDETGQWEDTLIIFTSDHGEQLGDHHLLGKLGYFDESFRIPLVIRAPGDSDAGRIVAAPTESIDVLPTLLDWLGAPPGRMRWMGGGPDGVRAGGGASRVAGRNCITSSISATSAIAGRRVRWGWSATPAACAWCRMNATNTCIFAALPPLFFDLAADPDQLDDRAGDPAYAALVRDYAQKALSWRLVHADRTLTHFRAMPDGLEERAL